MNHASVRTFVIRQENEQKEITLFFWATVSS